jgi:DNA mismatch repair protein MutS2
MSWKERPSPAPSSPKPRSKERPSEPRRDTSAHETTIFAAELGETVFVDLHGMSVDEARDELDKFLDTEFMNGTEVVKIVHGRGEQKLRKMVENHLAKHKLVEYHRGSQSPSQQGAVTFAVLAKK